MDKEGICHPYGRELMQKQVKTAGLLLLGILIVLQFFQPEKNAGTSSVDDLVKVLSVPDSISAIMIVSCYDCHSNNTVYPWYSRISPVSWYLSNHIKKGLDKLNFSEFGTLEKSKQVGLLSDICEVIESGTMPLKSYLLVHRRSRLDLAEAEDLCSWADLEATAMLKK
ncbi:MAG: heme-binding domain-containing protein [Bacteroidota bacterium]